MRSRSCLSSRVPDSGSFAKDLRALLGTFAELLETTPLGAVLAHLGVDANSQEPEVRRYMDRRTAGAYTVVERAIERGELPEATDPTMVLPLAIGPVLSRAFYGPRPDEQFLDLVVATLTAGVPLAMQSPSSLGAPSKGRARARRG